MCQAITSVGELVLCEQKGWDRERWVGASKGVNNLLPFSVQGQFLISVLAKVWYRGAPPHYSASKIINYAMCGSGVTAIDSALCVKRIAILGLVAILACFSGRYATDLHA